MSARNTTILVIDDEAEQRELMRAILGPNAYTVLEAADTTTVWRSKRHTSEKSTLS